MKRSRLARVLQEEAILRGIRIEYAGDQQGRGHAGGHVLATFEEAAQLPATLTGADGVHSVVRRAIDPRPRRVDTSADELRRCDSRS